MNPLAKKLTTAVLCVTALTSPLFMSGCSFSKIANGVQQGAQKASQQDIKVFNNYIEAIGDFNSWSVRFGYAINPSVQKLKEGQHLTSFMAPHFDTLQQKLQAAKDAGVPYDDMKEPLDNVLAVLKDIVPVASELDTYYQTNSYQAERLFFNLLKKIIKRFNFIFMKNYRMRLILNGEIYHYQYLFGIIMI